MNGCPLCGQTGGRILRKHAQMIRSAFAGAELVRCGGCGLDYVDATPAQLEGLYEEAYFHAYRDAGMVFPTEEEQVRDRYARRLADAERRVGRGRLLEIGVGHGAFLNFARERGWTVTGLDISRYVADYVRDHFGIHVICGTLETEGLADASFDLVHLSHVLEHLDNPLATLAEIRRVLRPGGLLAIEVPNELENLYVRLHRVVGRVKPYPVPCTHVCFFTARTLRQMLATAAFQVERVRTMRDPVDPRPVRRLLKTLAGSAERWIDRGPLIEAFAVRPS